jgi:hypothetical protein
MMDDICRITERANKKKIRFQSASPASIRVLRNMIDPPSLKLWRTQWMMDDVCRFTASAIK